MSNSKAFSSYAEKMQEKSDFVEDMEKMNEYELCGLVSSPVEQVEGTKFKLGYALSIMGSWPNSDSEILDDWPQLLQQYGAGK
jgi:hypothetical protein